ncbi:hypothetical protein [Nocardioides sp. BYT-33-1]|uniref:hypothetical protein n=1 Tax=Nocardioides sp. BYT-33-1 TaxID=3416952 RepID=UPI003F529DDC
MAATQWASTRDAEADAYPNTYYPDKGANHTFCFTLNFAQYGALVSRARNSMETVQAQTVVNPLEQTCDAATDVILYEGVIDGYSGGEATCQKLNSKGYCDSWAVTIDWELIQAVATNDNYEARHTICHEIGHTLGVKHYTPGFSPDGATNSCMISGLADSGAAWTKTYGPHHVAHIDSWF